MSRAVHAKERLHVLPGEPSGARAGRGFWPFFGSNRQNMTILPPDDDTPKGQIVIQSDQPYFRFHVVLRPLPRLYRRPSPRVAEGNGKLGDEEDVRAVRWRPCRDGLQIVTAWENRHIQRGQRVAASGKIEPFPNPPSTSAAFALTPLKPEDFPPKIFDGEAFLDAAKKAGAEIKVD